MTALCINGDFLVASGSLPPGALSDFYTQAARIANDPFHFGNAADAAAVMTPGIRVVM